MLHIGQEMRYSYKNLVHFSKEPLAVFHASHIVTQGSPLLVRYSGHMIRFVVINAFFVGCFSLNNTLASCLWSI